MKCFLKSILLLFPTPHNLKFPNELLQVLKSAKSEKPLEMFIKVSACALSIGNIFLFV